MWVLLIPAIVLVYYVCSRVVAAPTHDVAQYEAQLLVIVTFFCVLPWYFVVGRIPTWAMVRNVRRQVLQPVVVLGADAYARARDSGGFTRSRSNVLCVTRTGIELWGGRGDSARPLRTLPWDHMASIVADGPHWSPAIAVTIAEDDAPLMISLLSNRVISFTRIRGRARVRLIHQLDALRHPGPAQAKVI
jgi:hypothetical protein